MLAIKAVNLELKVERRWDQLREWHAVGMTQPWKQGTKERTVENKIGSGLEGPGLENILSTGKITMAFCNDQYMYTNLYNSDWPFFLITKKEAFSPS